MSSVITGIINDLQGGRELVSSIVEELKSGQGAKFVSLPLEGLHDRVLTSSDWQNYVIARVWSYDASDEIEGGADVNERLQQLTKAVNFARHLSLRAILIEDLVRTEDLTWGEESLVNFAHALKRLCSRPHSTAKFQSFWLRMDASFGS